MSVVQTQVELIHQRVKNNKVSKKYLPGGPGNPVGPGNPRSPLFPGNPSKPDGPGGP